LEEYKRLHDEEEGRRRKAIAAGKKIKSSRKARIESEKGNYDKILCRRGKGEVVNRQKTKPIKIIQIVAFIHIGSTMIAAKAFMDDVRSTIEESNKGRDEALRD
jgi:hypothetical protein